MEYPAAEMSVNYRYTYVGRYIFRRRYERKYLIQNGSHFLFFKN